MTELQLDSTNGAPVLAMDAIEYLFAPAVASKLHGVSDTPLVFEPGGRTHWLFVE